MMLIDGHTKTCGLLGNPVEHTLSPLIHNTIAEALGENLVYVPFHVEKGYVEDAVKGAYALNVLGLNVTVPYKSEVISSLAGLDRTAAQIGAVNTLVRVENGYMGYNTDMPGLYRAMCADGVRTEGEKVLILGAGGVARAVAMLMAQKKAAQIIIMNRTLARAERIAGEVNGIVGSQLVSAMALKDYERLPKDKYLAIQATSVGMHPDTEAVVIEDAAFYQKLHTGYDLIFNPARTRFMKLVEENGGRAFNGAKMLLYQGIIAHELWMGRKISDELAAQVYSRMTEALGE